MTTIEQNLAREYGAINLSLTDCGRGLFADDPKLLNTCLQGAQLIDSKPRVSDNGLDSLGTGKFAQVYGLPQESRVCLKAALPANRNISSDLITESRYMGVLSRYLESKVETGPKAPKQYGLVYFENNPVMLLERVPEEFASLKMLEARVEPNERAELVAQAKLAHQRLFQALGLSTLRLGARDSKGDRHVSATNFMLPVSGYTGEENFYALDLVGNRRRSRIAAKLSLMLAGA